MRRALALALTFAWLTLCAATNGADRQLVTAANVALAADPYLELEVHDQDGLAQAGIAVVYYVGDVPKAGVTDQYGRKAWPLRGEGTRLSITGWVIDATAIGARAWVDELRHVQVRWDPGTQVVRVLARVSQLAPTTTPTPRPTASLCPTKTPRPSSTPLPTPTAWDGWYDASAIVEIRPGTWPGSYDIRVIDEGGIDVWMQTHEGGDYPHGCGPECTTQWGWMRLFFRCQPELPPSPPAVVTRIVTVTPGAPTEQATATGTATRTATPQPTLTPWIVTATPAIWEQRLDQVVRDAATMGITLHITPVYEWNDLGR